MLSWTFTVQRQTTSSTITTDYGAGHDGVVTSSLVSGIAAGSNGFLCRTANTDLGYFVGSIYLKGTPASIGQTVNVRLEAAVGYQAIQNNIF